MELQQLLNAIDERKKNKKYITVAIDGNSAAGKSSLAALLKKTCSCSVIPMDDFFLRPEQRTSERLAQPGGNIDYERFKEEVSEPLKTGVPFKYRPFDCRTMKLMEPVKIDISSLIIIEGVYSLHPYFNGGYDISVFMKLDVNEQHRRLEKRDPFLLQRFINEWLPMENRYFEHFRISEKCDIIYDASQFITGSKA